MWKPCITWKKECNVNSFFSGSEELPRKRRGHKRGTARKPGIPDGPCGDGMSDLVAPAFHERGRRATSGEKSRRGDRSPDPALRAVYDQTTAEATQRAATAWGAR